MLGGPSEPSRMGAQTGLAGDRFPYDAKVSGASIEGRATAADGTAVLTRTWPRRPDPEGHVLIVHGLAEHSGRYEHVGRWLGAAGFAVQAYDHRGFGGSGGRRAYVDRWSDLYRDLADRLAGVRSGADGRPVAVYGHSLGSLIVLGAVLDGFILPDALVLSAPAVDVNVNPLTRLAVGLLGRTAGRVELPNGIRGEQLSRDPEVGRRYFTDPRNHHRTTAAFGLAGIAAQRRCRERLVGLSVPTLVIHGSADSIVPVDASEPLGRLPGVKRRVYAGLRHEIHNEPEGEGVVADIAGWLSETFSRVSPGDRERPPGGAGGGDGDQVGGA